MRTILTAARPQIVPTGNLAPSTYNPRTADEKRLALIELSLRKLGWLLPVYAVPDGELLSGHQRHLVATERLHAKGIPVVYTKPMPLEKRKPVNIMFNRATNDLKRTDTSHTITARLDAMREVSQLAAALPDKEIDSPDWFPCLTVHEEPLAPLLKANSGRWDTYFRNCARALASAGIALPVVVNQSDRIINGLGRVQLAAESQATTIQVIRITAAEGQFAESMLNLLSMDFNIHERYADILRHNSFRRALNTKDNLGFAFVFDAFGDNVTANTIKLTDPTMLRKWERHYGRTVLDFGAGLLDDTRRLKAAGINCTPFEPFRTTKGVIDKTLALETVREFLAQVAAGVRWDSIFQNSIMNSVPFEADRLHIVTLIAALCSPKTAAYVCACSPHHVRFQNIRGKSFTHGAAAETLCFELDYEPRTVLGEFNSLPKVQKFHTAAEWHALWSTRFSHVQARYGENKALCLATCQDPKPIDTAALRAAIEFEFDLPYPDGSRLGLVTEALSAFESRLGIKL